MAVIHDNVFDAAIAVVKACDKGQLTESNSTIMINSIALTAGNYASGNYSSGSDSGKYVTCMVSDSSDMLGVSVATSGTAKKVRLLDASVGPLIVADITSGVVLTSADAVNFATFSVIFLDP